MSDARESLLWHRLIVRELATMEQLNAALALLEKEPELELGAALIRMGVVTPAQVAELVMQSGKVTVRCRGCQHEQELNARLLSSGVACPKCQAPMERAVAAPPPPPVSVPSHAQAVVIPPGPTKPVDKQLVLIIAGIAALFLLAIVIAFTTRTKKKPVAEESVAAAPAPVAPVRPTSSEPTSIEERVRALEAQEKAAPARYRTLHRAWTALLPELKGEEGVVREQLERIEGAANLAYREAYRHIQEEVRDLLGARKPLEAHHLLLSWTLPEELDIDGARAKERMAALAAIGEMIALEQKRGAIDADLQGGRAATDPAEALRAYLGSEHVVVRAEAEKALVELRAARAIAQMRATLSGRREAALARVQEARRQAVADATSNAERMARWEKRLVEESAKKPWPLKTLGVDLPESVSVKKLSATHVVFGGAGIEFTWGLAALKTEFFGNLLLMAADAGDGRDQLEAGRWAVRRGATGAAQTLFDRAVRTDRALAAFVPDLAKIARGIASIHGAVSLTGNTIAITYDFRGDDQVKDFAPLQGTRVTGSRGLNISGFGLHYAVLKEMQFAGQARIRVATAGVSSNGGYALGASFEVGQSEYEQIILLVQGDGPWRIFRRAPQGGEVEIAKGEVDSAETLELSLDGTRIAVGIGGKTVWTGSIDRFERVQPFVGGVAFSSNGSSSAYSSVRIDGRASPEWVMRLHAERSTVLESELAKEAKLTKEELAAVPPVSARPFASMPAGVLPLEAEIAAAIPARVATKLREARGVIAKLELAQTAEEFDRRVDDGFALLNEVVAEAPWFVPALYYRAECRFAYMDDREGALADLAAAVKLQPQFVEARLARASLLLVRSKTAEAERELAAALEAVPDLSLARLLRARLLYYGGRTKEALEEVELAWRLSPGDASMRRAAKRLRNAIVGPLWTQSETVESAHYRLRAEVPATAGKKEQEALASAVRAKAKASVDRLEALRAWFPTLVAGTPTRSEKPSMFVFASAEGYYVYADFSQGHRMEHSVGCYVPDVRQLLFFEDTSAADTMETMMHESFHEYLDTLAPGAPTWLNEGTAEYAAGARVEEGRVVGVGPVMGRLRYLQALLARGQPLLSFALIMNESQAQFYGIAPQVQYAQAWSMVHFLRHFDQGRYKPVLDRYTAMLVEGKGGEEAYAATFAKENLKAMQQEWLGYVERLER